MTEFINVFINFIISIPSNLILLFLENPLAQTVGFLGFGMSMLTFLSGNDKQFMVRLTIVSALWALHFLLLAQIDQSILSFVSNRDIMLASGFIILSPFIAGVLNVIDIGKNLLAIRFPMNKIIAVCVVIIYIIFGYVMLRHSDKITDMLPVIGSIGSTIILFTMKGVWMRIGFIIMLMGWLTYNISIGSIGGATTDIILTITGIYGIWKMKKEEHSSNK